MKEYRQETGGRRIKGDDLKAIQEIALLSEKLLAQYGSFVISGCEVNGSNITSGIVMLDGKACTFNGVSGATFPYYIKKSVASELVPYESQEKGAGYEIYSVVEAMASDSGAFRLDNAPRFNNVFKPKNAGNADTLNNKTAASFAPSGFGNGGEQSKIISDQNLYDHVGANARLMGARVTNAPSLAWFYFDVEVYSHETCFVVAKPFYSEDIYVRKCNDGKWDEWKNIADANTAVQLKTARTIWGQGFNGTGNITGNMYGVGSIASTGTIRTSGVFSAGEDQDDSYGYYNATRPSYLNNASCYAMVRCSVVAFGIGYNTSNQIVMGSANTNKTINPWITIGSGGIYQGSDERIKNIKDGFEPTLEDIATLPVFYYELKKYPGKVEIGTSAQKVREKFPELVSEDGEGMLSVSYSKLSVLALKGIALQNKEVENLKAENKLLNDRLSKIEKLLKTNSNE